MECRLVFWTWIYNFISPPFRESEKRNLYMLLFYAGQQVTHCFCLLKFMLDSG